jgi:hypothetical protein
MSESVKKKRINLPIAGLDWPIGVQKVEASRFSRQSAHESGKVFSPTHRPLLPLPPAFPRNIPGTNYLILLEAESIHG